MATSEKTSRAGAAVGAVPGAGDAIIRSRGASDEVPRPSSSLGPALWRIVKEALESPVPIPAQTQRDLVHAVRELERSASRRLSSLELQASLEAQAAEGASFRSPQVQGANPRPRWMLGERRKADKILGDLSTGQRRARARKAAA